MIEILILFLNVSLFGIFLLIPYNQIINFDKIKNINFYGSLSENFIFFLNFLLLLSFFKLTLDNIILISLFSSIFILILFKKNFFELIKFKIILFFFIFLIFLLSVDLSYNLTLYWDSQSMWLPKAIMFFENKTITELKSFLRPEYPYFGSFIWAFFWKLSFLEYEYFGRISFIIVFCLSIFALLEIIKLNKINHSIICLIFILFLYDYWHFRGTQEILVFSFLLLASKYLFLIIAENNLKLKNLIYFFLCINLVIWTKNEGLFFSLFIFISFLKFSKYNFKIKLISLATFAFLIFLRFSIYSMNDLNIGLSPDFKLGEIFNIFIKNINIDNLIFIFKHLIFSIIKFPFIFLSLIIYFVLFFQNRNVNRYNFVIVYLIFTTAFIFFIYLSSLLDLKFMVVTGLNRLVFESFAPILILLLPYIKIFLKR